MKRFVAFTLMVAAAILPALFALVALGPNARFDAFPEDGAVWMASTIFGSFIVGLIAASLLKSDTYPTLAALGALAKSLRRAEKGGIQWLIAPSPRRTWSTRREHSAPARRPIRGIQIRQSRELARLTGCAT